MFIIIIVIIIIAIVVIVIMISSSSSSNICNICNMCNICNISSMSITFCKGGVQWKQGVVICMVLYTSLLYATTPIHCTPLRLHPPVMNIQDWEECYWDVDRDFGGGDDTVRDPRRAQSSQCELFELNCFNSSFSSLSSY